MLAASLVMASPLNALACTQVYVGSELTTTGDTYVGRAEDWTNRYAKCFGIQDRMENPRFLSYENDSVEGTGFDYTLNGTSYRYTYVRDLPLEWGADDGSAAERVYSEAGINEKGVAVSATLTTDAKDDIVGYWDDDWNWVDGEVDSLVDTGIGEYNLGDYLLSVSDTARDGVQKLGAIIDEYGSQDCNQIIIADSSETWIFAQLSGHQWIAILMPDDVASVNPNIGGLQYKADLDDESTCLHSEGILSVFEDAGREDLVEYYEDGTPNIFKTYGAENSGSSQNTRYAQGLAYFGAPLTEGEDYTLDEDGAAATLIDPQLTFTPSGEIDTFKAIRSLATRGEGTPFDANENTALYAIGNNRNVDNHMFQIREGLSSDIAIIQWEALSRCEFSLFIPSYSALLTEVPEEYYPSWKSVDPEHLGNYREDVGAAMTEIEGKNLDYIMMDINTLAYNNRSTMAANTRAYLDVLQNQIIEQQDQVDAIMQQVPADQRSEFANNAFAVISEQAYNKCSELLSEMRAYLNTEDAERPAEFCPSNYNAADGTVADGIAYYANVKVPAAPIATFPKITTQPSSATYTQGDETTPLSVEATVEDGSELSYQWQVYDADAEEFVALEGETASTLAVSSDTVGTTEYRVVVTNSNGLSTTSDVASVTVKAKPEEPGKTDPGKTDDNNNTGNNTNNTTPDNTKTPAKDQPTKTGSKGNLPQTGDNALVAVAGAAVAGIVVIGTGVALNRKRQQ